MHKTLSVLALALLSAPSAAQAVIVVDRDAGPGSDFDDLGDAIVAAPPNATLLVRPGTYDQGTPTIDKPLTIVADSGGPVLVTDDIDVFGLAAGESLLLSGLTLDVPIGSLNGALNVLYCQGAVTVVDCTVIGNFLSPNGAGDALFVIDSASVTCVRSTFTGREVITQNLMSSNAVTVHSSTVALYECLLVGGPGTPGSGDTGVAGRTGGAGLSVRGSDPSTIFVDGCTLTGGPGGRGTLGVLAPDSCSDGGEGGPGLRSTASGTEVALVDSVVEGGLGGPGPGADCSPGSPGPAQELHAGTATTLPALGRTLTLTRFLRQGGTLDQTLTGPQGEAVALFYSLEPGPAAFDPLVQGAVHLGVPFLQTVVGLLPASGVLEQPLRVPDLEPVFDGLTVHVQSLHVDPATLDVFASAPSPTVIVDAAF